MVLEFRNLHATFYQEILETVKVIILERLRENGVHFRIEACKFAYKVFNGC